MTGFRNALRRHCMDQESFRWYTISMDEPGQRKANVDVTPTLEANRNDKTVYYSPVFRIMTDEVAQYEHQKQMIWCDYYWEIGREVSEPEPPGQNDRIIALPPDGNGLWERGNTDLSDRIRKAIMDLTEMEVTVKRIDQQREKKIRTQHPLYQEPRDFAKKNCGIGATPTKEDGADDKKHRKAILRREVRMAKLNEEYYDKPFHVLTPSDIQEASEVVSEKYYELLGRMRDYYNRNASR